MEFNLGSTQKQWWAVFKTELSVILAVFSVDCRPVFLSQYRLTARFLNYALIERKQLKQACLF